MVDRKMVGRLGFRSWGRGRLGDYHDPSGGAPAPRRHGDILGFLTLLFGARGDVFRYVLGQTTALD